MDGDLDVLGLSDFDMSALSSSWDDSDYVTASTSDPVTPANQLGGHQVKTELLDSDDIPPPPFHSVTPEKLQPIEQVMKAHPGKEVATLRLLTIALARDAVFGRTEMGEKSLSGKAVPGVTGALDQR